MVLPVSPNPISLLDVQTEFGGTSPIGLNEYYAGGAYVGAGTIGYPNGVATAIPASGPLGLFNFHGASATDILWGGLSALSFSALNAEGAPVTATLRMNSDGTTTRAVTGTLAGNWLDKVGAGIGGAFEVRQVFVSDNAATGPTTFTPVTSNITFGLTQFITGNKTAVFDVEIQPIGNSAKREVRRVTLFASVSVTGGGL